MPSPVPDLSVTRIKKAYEDGLPKGGIQFAKLFKPTFAKLNNNKDNFRTWKAGLQICIQASQPSHFTIDLWSFLTGKVSEEEVLYKTDFPVTYATESTQITGILKSALAAVLHADFLIDLSDEKDLYDWLSQIQPPITALVGMKLCKELQLQTPDNFTNILEYCEDMKRTYKKINECEGDYITEKNYLLQIMMGVGETGMYAHEHDNIDGTVERWYTDLHQDLQRAGPEVLFLHQPPSKADDHEGSRLHQGPKPTDHCITSTGQRTFEQ
jgi:hypothetical protein